jgi:hypothetical protein
MHDTWTGLALVLMFLLLGLKLLGGLGLPLLRGFSEGFWAAVWNRILVGKRSRGGTSPSGCLVVILVLLFVLFLIGLVGSIRV